MNTSFCAYILMICIHFQDWKCVWNACGYVCLHSANILHTFLETNVCAYILHTFRWQFEHKNVCAYKSLHFVYIYYILHVFYTHFREKCMLPTKNIQKMYEISDRVWHRIDIYASIHGKKCVIDLPVDKKRNARYCRILMFNHNGMNFWLLSNRQQAILTKSTYLAPFLGITWSLMQQSSVKPARNQSLVMTRSNPTTPYQLQILMPTIRNGSNITKTQIQQLQQYIGYPRKMLLVDDKLQ